MTSWSFLTNHARVLLSIANRPDIRLREIAALVGISERRAHAIVSDLTASGYLVKERTGRRNRYQIQESRPLADDLADHRSVGDILKLLLDTTAAERDE